MNFMNFKKRLDLSIMCCCLVKKLSNFSRMFGLKQLRSEPTGVSVNSQSILDLVLAINNEKICQSGVLDIGLSDHKVIIFTRKVNKCHNNPGNHTKGFF